MFTIRHFLSNLLFSLLFYTTYRVYKVNLDGSGHTRVSMKSNRIIISIAIDYAKRRICWVNWGTLQNINVIVVGKCKTRSRELRI